MKTKDGFIQGYNAQAAVDAEAQVIVAHGLDANASDQHQLTPMVDAVEANMGRKPEQVSADAIARTPISRRWRSAQSTPISRRAAPSTRAKDKAEARASPPCERKSRPADTQPPIDCASNCPSRCSGRSNRPVASVSS